MIVKIRKAFETEIEKSKDDPKKLQELKDKEKYDTALLDQRGIVLFNNSTVVIIEAAVSKLAKTEAGHLAFKLVVTQNEQSSVQMDDFLAATKKSQKSDKRLLLLSLINPLVSYQKRIYLN